MESGFQTPGLLFFFFSGRFEQHALFAKCDSKDTINGELGVYSHEDHMC